MNRKEIKKLAKAKIKGNKWNIWWPLLVISVLESILERLFLPQVTFHFDEVRKILEFNVPKGFYLGSSVIGILFAIITAGYLKYVLNFVRTGKFDTNDILNTIKSKWLNLLIAEILTGIIIGLCSVLFVIPGIIMALAYTLVTFLVIDTDVSGSDALKKSREMMKGYKWNYFVFDLSFIGWILLVPLTLGILLIWLAPYMIVANTIYYDKLKEVRSK